MIMSGSGMRTACCRFQIERGNNMARGKGKLPAGMTRRKDGKIENRFTVEGQRYSVYGDTADECREKELEKREQIKEKLQFRKANITVEKFYTEWQEGRKKSVKESTQYTQNRQFKHIAAELGKKKIVQLEAQDVKHFQRALQKKKDKNGEPLLSDRGVNLIMSLLDSILAAAVRERIITWNPCEAVMQLKVQETATKTIHRALSLQETRIFFQYAACSFYCPLFKFLLVTGMRSGEAAALTWNDIDREKGVIHITKTVSRVSDKKVKIDTPKTAGSVRDIPLTAAALKALEEQRMQYNALFPTVANIERRIFTQTDGKSLLRTANLSPTITMIVRKAQKAGEPLERFGAHAFRDTYATVAIEQGMNPQTLKELLGHSSYKMTMDKYAQVMEETKKDQAGKIDFAI